MALGKDRHASLGSHGCEASHSVRRKSLFSKMLTFGHKIPGRVVTRTFLGHFPWHRFGNQNALVVVAGRAISLKTLAGKRSGGMYMYTYVRSTVEPQVDRRLLQVRLDEMLVPELLEAIAQEEDQEAHEAQRAAATLRKELEELHTAAGTASGTKDLFRNTVIRYR